MNNKLTSIFFCLFLTLTFSTIVNSIIVFAYDDEVNTKKINLENINISSKPNTKMTESNTDYYDYYYDLDSVMPEYHDLEITDSPTVNNINNNIKIAPKQKPKPKAKSLNPINKPIKKKPVVSKPNTKSTPKKQDEPNKKACEDFINNKALTSTSKFLIWVDTNTQRTHIFSKSQDTWTLYKTFICTTGKDSTPTVHGVFTTKSKYYWVYDQKYNCYLKNVTRIYKGYLFHSVILNKYGQVTDGTLGRKKSHGCIRLSLSNSEWLYKNVPLGTTVFIN